LRVAVTRLKLGDRVILACSCEAEVVVPTVIHAPRHHVVRIRAHGKNCRSLGHRRGQRVVVRSRTSQGRRTIADISANYGSRRTTS
jgi:hypothetical protein